MPQSPDLLEGLYHRKQVLSDLLLSPGFKLLCEQLEAQERARRFAIFNQQARSFDSCFEVAALMNEIATLQMVLRMPQLLLEELNEQIQMQLNLEREEENA
jgi:hypothetical protein